MKDWTIRKTHESIDFVLEAQVYLKTVTDVKEVVKLWDMIKEIKCGSTVLLKKLSVQNFLHPVR